MQKDTSWGAIADWYDGMVEDTADSFQKNVLLPNLIRLVAPKQGMTILDIACGQGYFARAFAANGANVIACDISKELIHLAEEHSHQPTKKIEPTKGKNMGTLEYRVALSDKLPFVGDASIDVAVIVLALQNIERFSETLRECGRSLKIGGRLIIVLNHPAFRIPKKSSWRWEKDNIQDQKSKIKNQASSAMFRRIDGYMSEAKIRMDMMPGEKIAANKKFTISFHRPLQSYFKALNKAGLAVSRLEEWISHKKSESGPHSVEEDRMRKEIPMFLMIEARK
jgi:ubiquinone/menaquinone biosynthesis C-methylase UbiE